MGGWAPGGPAGGRWACAATALQSAGLGRLPAAAAAPTCPVSSPTLFTTPRYQGNEPKKTLKREEEPEQCVAGGGDLGGQPAGVDVWRAAVAGGLAGAM